MKTLSERNRILNEVKDSCYLAFFDGNPEEGGKEILTGRKKVNFPVATNGYVKSTNQLDFTGGEEDTVAYGETSQQTYTGKNLIYTTPSQDGGIKFEYDEDTGVTSVSGTPTRSYAVSSRKNLSMLSGETYTLSIDRKMPFGVCVGLTDTNGQRTVTVQIGAGSTSNSITLSKNIAAYDIYVNGLTSGTAISGSFIVQLEKSSSATAIEPYVGGIPAPNPDYPQDVQNINIGNVELCRLGDYQDYLYTENGKWYVHKETGHTSVQNFIGRATAVDGYRFSFTMPNGSVHPLDTTAGLTAFANIARLTKQGGTWDIKAAVFTFSNSEGLLYSPDMKDMTLEQANEWLSDNQFDVYYPLVTPTDEEITDPTTLQMIKDIFGDAIGVAKYWGVYDSEVGGTLLYYFILPYEVRIVKDSTITIKAGNCVLKEG